jgi:hypothetical protein
MLQAVWPNRWRRGLQGRIDRLIGRRMRAPAAYPRPHAAASYVLSIVLLLTAAASASEPAGRVLFTTGEVTAEDGERPPRPITRHDVVFPGETLRTAAAAHVLLRMLDDALLALGPDSRLVLDRYASNGDAGSVVLRFLRGTLRTVTGAISKGGEDTYRMATPVATIGVRGTRYAIELCEAECVNASRPAGLYGHVGAGAIAVSNDAGSLALARNDYFHVAASDVAPRRLEKLPDGILDDGIPPAKAGA